MEAPQGPKVPKLKMPKIKMPEMPAQSFKEKNARLVNMIPIILMLVAAIVGGLIYLKSKTSKKKETPPPGAPGAPGTPGAAGGAPGAGGAAGGGAAGPKCPAPIGEGISVEGGAEYVDPKQVPPPPAPKTMNTCLRKAMTPEPVSFKIYPTDGDPCDTCLWTARLVFGEGDESDELPLDQGGMDVTGRIITAESAGKLDGMQDLMMELKFTHKSTIDTCKFRILGKKTGPEIKPEGSCISRDTN